MQVGGEFGGKKGEEKQGLENECIIVSPSDSWNKTMLQERRGTKICKDVEQGD